VDLFVRVSNKVAITMYQQLGYIVYRTVLEYYNGDPDEDAYGKVFEKSEIVNLLCMRCNNRYSIFRHEESLVKRCEKEIYDSTNTPCKTGRGRLKR